MRCRSTRGVPGPAEGSADAGVSPLTAPRDGSSARPDAGLDFLWVLAMVAGSPAGWKEVSHMAKNDKKQPSLSLKDKRAQKREKAAETTAKVRKR